VTRYYDRDGKPMALLEWAKRFEDTDYKVVAQTVLPDKTLVSTVWLGLDHQYGAGPPLIFETMVFPYRGDETHQERYTTEAEARAGHAAIVQRVMETVRPERSEP
jgi:hypothetical protein